MKIDLFLPRAIRDHPDRLGVVFDICSAHMDCLDPDNVTVIAHRSTTENLTSVEVSTGADECTDRYWTGFLRGYLVGAGRGWLL